MTVEMYRRSSSSGEGTALRPQPFLRWVGGKRLLLPELLPFVPSDIRQRRYHEPFAGAASLFFALQPRFAFLSDLNSHLIDCYNHVRENHLLVARHLGKHRRNNSKDYYYCVRDIYNRSQSNPAQAARFIYLNHTCYNGVFRVNTHGCFNVPFGDKPEPNYPTVGELGAVSRSLVNTSLRSADFAEALNCAGRGDFAYIDPPYPPLNGTSFFTHYTSGRFNFKDQERLSACVKRVHAKGCIFLMTNADTPAIRQLYKEFSQVKLDVTRYVSCKGKRYKTGELLISNYL